MVEAGSDALAVLEQAMDLEREGRGFYLRAARNADDEAGKQAFQNLADDEGKHLRLIEKQRDSLRSQNKWLDSPEIRPVGAALKQSLFPRGRNAAEQKLSSVDGEAGALLFGLEIESRSFDLYRKAAAEETDELGRRMFEFLAGEESLHFDILMMRYDLRFGPVEWSA